MCKEYWIQAYESAIEDLCDEYDIDSDEAEKRLINLLDENPNYLDNYITYEE
jgi:hypothetical protein